MAKIDKTQTASDEALKIRDITRRKLVEEQNRMLKHSIDIFYDGIYWMDTDNKFIYINDAGCKVLGYSRDELMSKTVYDINPRVTEQGLKIVWERLRTHGFFLAESVHRNKNGTEFPVEIISTYVQFADKEYNCGFARDITERKRAEEALRDRELRLRHAQKISGLGYWELNIVTGELYWSDLVYSQYGLDPKTFHPSFDVVLGMIHPEDRDGIMKAVQATLNDDAEYNIVVRVMRPDGKVRHIHTLAEVTRDAQRKPLRLIGTQLDITERKEEEEKLRESEERFKSIFDNALDGILVGDIETKKNLFGNKIICKMLGFEEGELNNTSMSDIHLEKDLPYVMKQFEKQARKEIELAKDIPMKRKDGSVFYADVNSNPITFGGKTYILGIFRDITKRKLAEEAIVKSEKNLKEAQRLAHIGSWQWTVETDTVKWSEELYHINGLDPNSSAPCYAQMSSFYTPQSWKILIAGVVKALQTGESYELDLDMVRQDGTIIHTYARGEADYDDNGKIAGLHGTVQDITKHKQMEKENLQLMEREHQARAEAIAAQKLDRMKSMFIASTSHELRTPLNAIIGFTSLILDGISGELNPEQKEQLEIVHASGKHLLTLINDIIDSSKIDAGKIELKVSEFDLSEVVAEAFMALSGNIKEKGLKISKDVEHITIKTDRFRLLQCVINLISNAVKYTENGRIELIVKIKEKKVYISVIDTGIGIKKEDIPKLFGPFVRLQTNLTYKTSGTGLGLYLVKKIAKDFLGGDVEVESEFGKGSKFTLYVPIELQGKS